MNLDRDDPSTQKARSDGTFTPQEWGVPGPTPKPVDPQGQPLGDAHFPVPHPSTFMGMANWANRSYMYWYDQAVKKGRENAERMRLDPVIDACLRLRSYPSALVETRVEPDDDTDPFQVQCAQKAQQVLQRTPGLTFLKRWLLDDGSFKGRTGAQVRYEWKWTKGKNYMVPAGFRMIDGDKLVFKWDDRVGILVMSSFPGPVETSERGLVWYANADEREQLIVHEFEPEDTSFYDPTGAGAIHGVGLRGKLFWLWALKQHVWGMSMDFLTWFARGLTICHFDGHNPTNLQALQSYWQGQIGQDVLFWPNFQTKDRNIEPIQRIEAGTASPQFLQTLIVSYFDDLFKLGILGQTLTSGTASTGLGSGVAQAHQATFENFVKYDCNALDETLTRDLLRPFYRANFPGVPCGRWVSDVDDPNVEMMLDNAQALYQMGAAVPEEPLMDVAGIPQAKTGDTILTNVQPMQPAAVGGLPENTPEVSGQPVQMSRKQAKAIYKAMQMGNPKATHLLRTRRLVIRG